MDGILQDLRYAARMLRRSPGATTVALATLALALGLSTSIFSLVNAISLRPLPYQNPNELLYLSSINRETGAFSTVSAADAADWKAASRLLTDIALYDERTFGVRLASASEEMTGTATSGNAFSMLGVNAALGRALTPEDQQRGAPAVIVLSHQLWRDRFASDPRILGRPLRVDGVPHEIVGVMPDRFGFLDFAKFWVPLPSTVSNNRGVRDLNAMARMRPGVSAEQVRDELSAVSTRLATVYPATNRDWEIHVGGVQDQRSEPFIYAIVLAGVFVLLIACANVGNLLLARGAARRNELAVRMMIGANRGRVLRQLITESALLAAIGGVLGLLLSLWGLDVLVYFLPIDDMPLWIVFGIDWRVLLFTLAALVLAVLTFGVAPALSVMRDDFGTHKDSGRRTTSSRATTRTRNTLVIAELALSLMLLASAAMVVRGSFVTARANPGFNPDPVLHVTVPLSEQRFTNSEQRQAYLAEALRRLAIVPGVSTVGAWASLPSDRLSGSATALAGPITAANSAGEAPRLVNYNAVTPDFFAALELPIARGRALKDSDRKAALISQGLAEELWPGMDALGRQIKLNAADQPGDWLTIVGVAGDQYRIATGEGGEPRRRLNHIYVPAAEGIGRTLTIMVRARDARPQLLAEPVRRALSAVDADQPITLLKPLADEVYDNVRVLRWLGALAASFALSALVLSAIGLFGVIAYAVTQRTREIGIRLALGASPADVVRLVTRSGSRLAFTGLAIGMAAALASARLVSTIVFGVKPYDPLLLGGVALVLGSIALLATWLPARRAARISPLTALQVE